MFDRGLEHFQKVDGRRIGHLFGTVQESLVDNEDKQEQQDFRN